MKYSKYISIISTIGDVLILNIFFNVGYCYLKDFNENCFSLISQFFFVYINIVWLISINVFKDYRVDRQGYKKEILFTYLKTVVFFFFLFLLFFQVFTFDYYQRDEIKYVFLMFFIALLIWEFFIYFLLKVYRKSGYNYRNVIVIGYSDMANELKDYFNNNPWTGYHFKGFFTHQESKKKHVVGNYQDMEEYVVKHNIDEIYILTNNVHNSVYKIISSITSKHRVEIRLVPNLSHFSFMSLKLIDYDLVPVLKVQEGPLGYWYNRSIKRLSDILISVFAIVFILSWMIPILAIINLFTDGGGAFFTQERSGLDNHSFKLYKFRTMRKNTEAHSRQATKDDHRITPIGRFLRKTSIDEMPQFFNVLIGNMSVVGPRPHMLNHTNEYKEMVDKFMIRHVIKPGLTGYAQIRGSRGEITKTRDIKERVKLDISYIENWSIWFDIKIIFLTIVNIVKGDSKAF